MSETFVPSRALDPVNNPYQNLLTNGGFEQWNGGTLFTNPPDTQNVADGWSVRVVGVTAYTISQEASNVDNGAYSMKVNITNVGSGTRLRVGQTFLFSNNSASVIGKTLSLSVRVKSNVAGVALMAVWSGGNLLSTAHTGDNTWQTLSLKFAPGGVGLSVHVGFDVSAGTAAPANGIFYVDSAILTFGYAIPTYMPDHSEVELLKTGTASSYQANSQNANLLTNGGFEIWQRGTPLTLGINQYGPDKWYLHKDGADVTTVTQITSAGNFDSGASSCQLSVTHTTSTEVRLIQAIEIAPQDVKNKTFSFAMRVKTTLAGVAISLYDGVNYWSSAPHSGSGAFETLSITATMGASASGLYAWVGWWSYSAPVTGTVIIDSAMLVKGVIPIPYTQPHAGDEFERCMRYYEASNPRFELVAPISRNAGINYVNYHTTYFSTQKSAVPTVTLSSFSLVLLHTPLSGNSSSTDTVNWTITPTAGLKGFQFGIVRTGDQTTYPLASIEFDWKAEVT